MLLPAPVQCLFVVCVGLDGRLVRLRADADKIKIRVVIIFKVQNISIPGWRLDQVWSGHPFKYSSLTHLCCRSRKRGVPSMSPVELPDNQQQV